MKFKFKIQPFQSEAASSIVKVFSGQSKQGLSQYRRDIGKKQLQVTLDEQDIDYEIGYRNSEIDLSKDQLLRNIRTVQTANNIKNSATLEDGLGLVSLDIEMETGERVIIVTGCINVLVSRVSGTLTKYNSCIA